MTTRRPAVLTVAIMILLVMVAEAGARSIEPNLKPAVSWGNEDTDLKIEQIEVIAASGGVDVVFIGSSIVNVGFDPAQFIEQSAWAGSAYNASLIGSTPQLQERWTVDVVLPSLQPKVIVVGVTSRSFNDNARNPAIAYNSYMKSQGRASWVGEANPAERIAAALARNSALARLKPRLRQPTALAAASGSAQPEVTITDLGNERTRADDRYTFKQGYRQRIRTRALNDFEMGGIQVESLERLVAAAEDAGTTVVLVNMPVYEPDHMRLHPNNREDFDAYLAVVAAFADAQAVGLLQPPGTPWRRGLFADTLHVNGTGTERLTRWLARVLEPPN
ncbi:MAG: hypothetical protein HKN91_04065 [Acidimicrobiia bacterium]|nr:hypothetical protein [Acidimicrobiia bacterium]